jgi:L-amino acid N-acyltransferase YncA
VRACIEPDNAASAALARKLGFVAGSLVIEEDGSCVMVWTLLAAS